jgi:hypothetical protein
MWLFTINLYILNNACVTKSLTRNVKRRHHLGDLGVERKIIL